MSVKPRAADCKLRVKQRSTTERAERALESWICSLGRLCSFMVEFRVALRVALRVAFGVLLGQSEHRQSLANRDYLLSCKWLWMLSSELSSPSLFISVGNP
jgi:hypothetical protein